jgi:4-hydroxyphenylpyruvate dioxygenase-like putative hemolysin
MASGASIIVLVQGLSRDCQVQKFVDNFGPGVQHLGIAVDDLDAALDKLRACGGAPEFDIIVGDGIRQVFLRRDPGSGVRIELIERKGGTFTDDTIERLYRSFEDAGAY